jgi:hypothetical protein
MKEIQYLDIILIGLLKNERLLKNYLIRKQKEAENINFVSDTEFIQKCNDTVSLLENNIETQYLEKRNKLYQTVESLKSKNKPFEEELKLAEKLSKDSFYVQLSPFTKDKFKGEIWYNQIKSIKKYLDEISNQNFKFDVELRDLDIDNYLNFIFSQKSISRKSKENAVKALMKENKQEKTNSSSEIWNDYVFNQQNYWEEVTEVERELFDELRLKSLEELKSSFENFIKGSPKPRITLEKEFEAAVFDRLSKEPYQETTLNLINAILPKDLNKLAIVIGKLDFIKALQKPEKPEIKGLTLTQIALKCFYEGKVLNRENAKKELEGTKHSSGDKLYYHFSKWSNNTDRRACPDGKQKLRNKIKDIECVIEKLPSTNRVDAIKDLNILQEHLNKY